MTSMQWSSFANQHAMITSATLIIGSITLVIGRLSLWPIGIYSLLLGIFIAFIEYPRGAKSNSNANQAVRLRPKQHYLSNQFTKLGLFYSNYFNRFIILLILSLPCFFTVSTLIPALNLIITSCLYLLSNYHKEKWIEIEQRAETYRQVGLIKPPDRPPPRDLTEI